MSKHETSLILIVDDEPIYIEALNEVLEEKYEVIFATSGMQALELARKSHPDLVLLDVMMPQMDGYEVCHRLKSDTNTVNIPVIFVTGLSDMEAEVRGLEVGAIDYITKPISPPIVKMRVHNHIELKHARDSLTRLAVTDSLTDLANRRRFDEVLQAESNRLSRLHQPLSLIMLDVDFFKKYNDTYGHVVGDICLQQVAYTIRGSLHRPADLAARYGGEEFACILPNTDEEGTLIIAERIRANITALNIPHETSDITTHVTVSMGAITINPFSDTCLSEVIKQADSQLYLAKQNGRNQVYSTSHLSRKTFSSAS